MADRLRLKSIFLLCLFACFGGVGQAQETRAQQEPNDLNYVPDPLAEIPSAPQPASVKDGFTFVAVGDLLYGRPAIPQAGPSFLPVLKLLRSGDVTFANLEGTLFDRTKLFLPPRDGDLLVGLPAVAKDIKEMGFSVLSKANNHSDDWGREGLAETEAILRNEGLPYAGVGNSRASARKPAFVDTQKGRAAVVAVTSTFLPNAPAEDQVGDVPARPGVSALRTRQVHLVTKDELGILRKIAARYTCTGCKADQNGNEVTLAGQSYRASDTPGLTYEMNPYDEADILRAVRGAKQEADMVVFSIHAHEAATGVDDNNPTPGDFLPVLFHRVIDAGADMVAAHGPHALRGVEIYKGKPIFYGLGTFIFQGTTEAGQDTLERLKVDPRFATHFDYKLRNFHNPSIWYQGLLTTTRFERGKVVEVRLYPIDTGVAEPGKMVGIPRLATGDAARKALERVIQASRQFGTKIDVEGGVGVIRPTE